MASRQELILRMRIWALKAEVERHSNAVAFHIDERAKCYEALRRRERELGAAESPDKTLRLIASRHGR